MATAAEIGAMGELASAVDMPPAGQAETQLAAQPAPAMPTEPTWYDDSADAAPVSEAGAEAGAVMAGLDPMTALDPFDALHTPWDVTDIDVAPAPSSSPEQDSGVSPGAPPLDELSLGSGVDAQELWGDDIVALPWPSDDAGREHAAGAVGLDEAAHADASAADAGAAEVNWADAPAIPSADAVIADDAAATEALGEAISTSPGADATAMTAHVEPPGMPEAGGWPGPLLAEYAPYVSEPPAISPVAIDPTQDTVEGVVPPNRHRVSAVLDRLAERVRDGEIDVTSVAPDATDAGILALVLAALLGGSSTSR